jgi:carbon monoxide dehydrogenase subunit G
MIHVEQKFEVRAPRAEVWAFISDMNRVAPCVPGVEKVEAQADGKYHMRLSTKIGPIKATFDGLLTFVETRPPDGMRVQLDGKDTITGSKIRVAATVELSEAAEGVVTVVGKADVDVLGALGKYGQGVADKKAAELGAAFADKMRAEVEDK